MVFRFEVEFVQEVECLDDGKTHQAIIESFPLFLDLVGDANFVLEVVLIWIHRILAMEQNIFGVDVHEHTFLYESLEGRAVLFFQAER